MNFRFVQITLYSIIYNQMDEQKGHNQVILIYHNFRGMAQHIRYFLYYLEVPFTQILLDKNQTLKDKNIPNYIDIPTDADLPILIDGEYLMTQAFSIIRHLCTLTNREDLLGCGLQENTIVRQVYYKFLLKKKRSIEVLFKFGERAVLEPLKKEEIRKAFMQESHKLCGAISQLIKLKLRHPQQRYILGHITLLDFLLYQLSFYQVNLFGSLEQQNCNFLQIINSVLGTDLSAVKDPQSIMLRLLRQFKKKFQDEPFYQKNKKKLQSYKVICPAMGQNSRKAFKYVWLGETHYVERQNCQR